MKLIVLLFAFLLLLSFSESSSAQEVQFPPSILSAGGAGGDVNNNQVTRWRLGYINIIQLKNDNLKSGFFAASGKTPLLHSEDWSINTYPNPTTNYVNIQFDTSDRNFFGIRLIDITGQKLIERKVQAIDPGEIVKLDLRKFTPAIYIVQIWSDDNTIHCVTKVSKN